MELDHDQWAAREALRAHHRELMKLPLQDLLPDLFSDGLIKEETQERILHPRAVFIKREVNQLILQDVRQAVRARFEHLDSFLKGLHSLQPAVGLSKRIRGTYVDLEHDHGIPRNLCVRVYGICKSQEHLLGYTVLAVAIREYIHFTHKSPLGENRTGSINWFCTAIFHKAICTIVNS